MGNIYANRIFLLNKCFVDIETILLKYEFNYKNTTKFFVTKIKILNEAIFIDILPCIHAGEDVNAFNRRSYLKGYSRLPHPNL